MWMLAAWWERPASKTNVKGKRVRGLLIVLLPVRTGHRPSHTGDQKLPSAPPPGPPGREKGVARVHDSTCHRIFFSATVRVQNPLMMGLRMRVRMRVRMRMAAAADAAVGLAVVALAMGRGAQRLVGRCGRAVSHPRGGQAGSRCGARCALLADAPAAACSPHDDAAVGHRSPRWLIPGQPLTWSHRAAAVRRPLTAKTFLTLIATTFSPLPLSCPSHLPSPRSAVCQP